MLSATHLTHTEREFSAVGNPMHREKNQNPGRLIFEPMRLALLAIVGQHYYGRAVLIDGILVLS